MRTHVHGVGTVTSALIAIVVAIVVGAISVFGPLRHALRVGMASVPVAVGHTVRGLLDLGADARRDASAVRNEVVTRYRNTRSRSHRSNTAAGVRLA